MKYIRTKDGRIITFAPKEKYENDKATFDWFVANYCGGGINVLKIADTIEELCDEFVREQSNYYKPIVMDTRYELPYLKQIKKGDLKSNRKPFEIYGAIWTDKGLIYVAKMNDKGELELL